MSAHAVADERRCCCAVPFVYAPVKFAAAYTATSYRVLSTKYLLSVDGGLVGSPTAHDCEQPQLWACSKCGGMWSRPCGSNKSRFCKPCAGRYRRQVQKVAHLGLVRVLAHKQVVFITLTAPSSPHCMRRDHPGCDASGKHCKRCPCSVTDFDLALWNFGHSERKNDLITALRRGECNVSGKRGKERFVDVQYFGGVETQDGKRKRNGFGRHALHDHLIVVFDRDVQLSTSAVKRVAMRLGFGHEVDVQVFNADSHEVRQELSKQDAGKIAAYAGKVSHYVSKACDERADVPWPDDPSRPKGKAKGYCWRSWTRSRSWACTMAEVRWHKRKHDETSTAALPPPQSAQPIAFNVLLASYADKRGPPRAELVQLSLFDSGGVGR